METAPPCNTKEESVSAGAGCIQVIDKGSVHRICSGQVVLNLATAVKELVENSLDAGATNIEVRLKEHGSELVEVIDNGHGVESNNFRGLTLKHHTSKLRDFSDLTSVDTFGFRGEALSSLCALSKLSITTRHKDSPVATKLDYDHNGALTSQSPCARQQGTTVSVQNLFSTLPVRHKEFQRNLKKEFAKMAQVLSAYGLISTGVRINCFNQAGKGKKSVIVSTNGNDNIKENITNIFGAKQVGNILEFEQVAASEEVCTEYNITHDVNPPSLFKINGYISTCEHGRGRSSTDRQFLFVNKRPCDLQKVSRIVNEVYRMFNRHQYPFFILNISLDKESVDVNVTPDKRQIFMQKEKLLLAIIKTSLLRLLEPRASVYAVSQPAVRCHTITDMFHTPQYRVTKPVLSVQNSCPEVRNGKSISSTLANLKRSFTSAFSKPEEASGDAENDRKQGEKEAKQRKLDTFVVKSAVQGSQSPTKCLSQSSVTSSSDSCIELSSPSEISTLTDDVETNGNNHNYVIHSSDVSPSSSQTNDSLLETYSSNRCLDVCKNSKGTSRADDIKLSDSSPFAYKIIHETGLNSSQELNKHTLEHRDPDLSCLSKNSILEERTIDDAENSRDNSATREHLHGDLAVTEAGTGVGHREDDVALLEGSIDGGDYTITVTEVDKKESIRRRERTVAFSLEKLKRKLTAKCSKSMQPTQDWCRSFRAKISPTENQAAEEELRKTISKDMFPQMEVLGQFNLGFIITKLGQDLFIIDQHATDEKYNFEMLQKYTVIESQKLIQPQKLELTAANESILMDNVEIFHKNGFDLQINEEAPPTQRVKLVSTPISKNWTFGKDDIDELVFMLSDSPGVMCRPSRIRAMFASRSCRKSIMIGTALNHTQMKKLVHHMSEIEQPWNCPHGRPTMRHLINLDMLPK